MRLFFFLLLLVAAVSAFPKNENFLPPAEDLGDSSNTEATVSSDAPPSTEASSSTISNGDTRPTNAPTSPSGSQVPVQTTTTTGPQTAKPFDIETQTFPNDVHPISAKLILQEAIQLSNQINQLSQEIVTLKANIDPDNSPLILALYNMQNTSVELQANLTNIQKDLNGAIETMNPVIARYNNVSRVFSCYVSDCKSQITTTAAFTTALFTGTTPAPSCDRNFTANSTVQTFSVDSYKDQQCNLRIDATQGHISVDFTGTGEKANFTVVDLNTAAVLKPNAGKLETSTTSLMIQINAGDDAFAFNMAYDYIDPCNPDGESYCDLMSANCTVNAAGQPYCTCLDTCAQPNGDGTSCSPTQCSKVYKSKNCDASENGCTVTLVGANCTSKCEKDKSSSFFERWLLP